MSGLTQKVVKHTLWPVSYLDERTGNQVDSVWTNEPYGMEFTKGESFVVETLHPVDLAGTDRDALIADLEEKLEALKS